MKNLTSTTDRTDNSDIDRTGKKKSKVKKPWDHASSKKEVEALRAMLEKSVTHIPDEESEDK